jgi:hypothetical protein
MDPLTVPAPPSGFQLGGGAFEITLTDLSTRTRMSQLASPLALNYRLNSAEIHQADGDLGRVKVAALVDDSWVALPCTTTDTTLDCSTPHMSLFALIVAPAASGALDTPVAGGRFYKQANGFNGAGDLGFAVVDDANASFWSEYQRLGGVDRIGYPISPRFQYGGFLTQAFQKLVLQWQPDLNEAVAANVFDDLSARGSDPWLETAHQIPSVPTATVDAGMAWQDVVDSHLQLLAAYPALRDFYDADPDAMAQYGLPMAVNQYGPVVNVRMQRGTLQFYASDGSVTVGNGGEVAKEAGLWPASAVAPSLQPSTLPLDADQRDRRSW